MEFLELLELVDLLGLLEFVELLELDIWIFARESDTLTTEDLGF
jgi:hypothetical protein